MFWKLKKIYKGIFLTFLNSLKFFHMSVGMCSSFPLISMSKLGCTVCNFVGGKTVKMKMYLNFVLANAISINSGYTSQIIEEHAGDKHPKHVGNKTECGLLGLLLHLGASYHQIREKNPEDSFLKVTS